MILNITMIVKDRPTLTRQALQSLLGSISHDHQINVTVVDDGSSEETRTILKAACCDPRVTVVRLEKERKVVGFNRNLAVWTAERWWGRGDLLYFSDNDCYFNPGWLDKLLSCWPIAVNHGIKLLGGYNHPYNQPTQGGLTVAGPPLSGLEIKEVDAVGGFSQLMSWETWDRYGPFDAVAQGVCQSEDWALCQRVRREGYKVAVVYPHLVYNAGFTSTGGRRAVGAEAMDKIPGVIME